MPIIEAATALQYVVKFRFTIVCLILALTVWVGWKAIDHQRVQVREWKGQAETAIAEHNKIIDEWNETKAALEERERLRLERERENELLWKNMDRILKGVARDWARTPAPDALRRLHRESMPDTVPAGVQEGDVDSTVPPSRNAGTVD